MIESVQVIGAGRVGSAVAARLRERGVTLDAPASELVLLCVPDTAIADVAASMPTGPWIAHVSGATPLTAQFYRRHRLAALLQSPPCRLERFSPGCIAPLAGTSESRSCYAPALAVVRRVVRLGLAIPPY